MSDKHELTRRDFLRLAGLAGGTALVAACAPPAAPAPASAPTTAPAAPDNRAGRRTYNRAGRCRQEVRRRDAPRPRPGRHSLRPGP